MWNRQCRDDWCQYLFVDRILIFVRLWFFVEMCEYEFVWYCYCRFRFVCAIDDFWKTFRDFSFECRIAFYWNWHYDAITFCFRIKCHIDLFLCCLFIYLFFMRRLLHDKSNVLCEFSQTSHFHLLLSFLWKHCFERCFCAQWTQRWRFLHV